MRDKGTGDGMRVAVALGGGEGVGEPRTSNKNALVIPRNALPFFNRASKDFVAYFWDGRVQLGANGQFESPLGDLLPTGFDSLLAVAASFPIAEQDEMLGRSTSRGGREDTHHRELVSPDGDPDNYQQRALGVYPNLIRRLAIEGAASEAGMRADYRSLFMEAYPNLGVDQLGMAQIGNALAAYIGLAFQLTPADWDRYVEGDDGALTATTSPLP